VVSSPVRCSDASRHLSVAVAVVFGALEAFGLLCLPFCGEVVGDFGCRASHHPLVVSLCMRAAAICPRVVFRWIARKAWSADLGFRFVCCCGDGQRPKGELTSGVAGYREDCARVCEREGGDTQRRTLSRPDTRLSPTDPCPRCCCRRLPPQIPLTCVKAEEMSLCSAIHGPTSFRP